MENGNNIRLHALMVDVFVDLLTRNNDTSRQLSIRMFT